MRTVVFLSLFFLTFLIAIPVRAFRFTEPVDGAVVSAGSEIHVRLDPGKIDPLFGVLLTISRGIVKPKLDSLLPFKWLVKIPENYTGPLTLRAIGRRYTPIPNPPRTSITIYVDFPKIKIGKTGESPSQF